MSELKYVRINLDLKAYFTDHRAVARILVKREFNTIEDLKLRITEIFHITNFFLTSANCFLPDTEDIHVLKNEETICVNPIDSDPTQKVKSKNKRRKAEKILSFSSINLTENDEPHTKKKKCKRKKSEIALKTKNYESSTTNSSFSSNSSEPQFPCVTSTESPKSVRLSRQLDQSPVEFTNFDPPKMNTQEYLDKKKINIVRIDTITDNKPKPDITNQVQTIVNYFENISPTEKEKTKEIKQSQPSNYTKIFLDQKNANEPQKVVQSSDSSTGHIGSNLSLKDNNDTCHKEESSPELNMESGKENQDKNIHITRRISKNNVRSTMGSVGLLLEQLRSSGTTSPDSEYTLDVVKRKRIRKRKRVKKSTEATIIEIPNNVTVTDMKPSSTTKPKIHVRFEGNETSLDRETLSEEPEDPIMENKSIFGSENIKNAPLMDNLEPKKGDIIAFKVLKLMSNFMPQPSEYIIAKVLNYLKDTETVELDVLSGLEEFSSPYGKLCMNPTELGLPEEQNLKHKELKWSDLLETKLLFP
ncbi:hypothetical protein ABEB36_011954 [Hypothenemus hampei]|uniref:Coilin n=1 Tax=Hypothenemus hampei TaxID=57062 RepID=A0ABD1E9V1_HYPHA